MAAMSFPLFPSEINLQIAEYLKADDIASLGNWRRTSKRFQTLLTPQFFESIILRNNEESSAIVNCVVAKYGSYIKELRFIASAPGDGGAYDGDLFPRAVEEILSNLNELPNLETLCIEIDINVDYRAYFQNRWDNPFHGDSMDEEEETCESWRILLIKTFTSIACNTTPGFKALVIRNLLPIKLSTFESHAFQSFLGHMQRFELYLHGIGSECGADMNLDLGFQEFVDKLDDWFFVHLTSVTDLTIHASEEGRLGGLNDPLYFTLPLLKALRLKNVYLSRGLCESLTSSADTLEVLELDGCLAYYGISDLSYSPVFWDKLFASLSKAKPAKLRWLRITPVDIPLANDHADNHRWYMKDEDWENVAKARKMLEDPRRRLFLYGGNRINTSCYAETDGFFNLKRFQRGDDQRAFDDLMRIVEANTSSHREKKI